jgi:hypothetical protein
MKTKRDELLIKSKLTEIILDSLHFTCLSKAEFLAILENAYAEAEKVEIESLEAALERNCKANSWPYTPGTITTVNG